MLKEYSPSFSSNKTTRPTGCFSLPPDFSTIKSPNCNFLLSYCFFSTSRNSNLLGFKSSLQFFVKLVLRITPTFMKGSFLPFHKPFIESQTSPSFFHSHLLITFSGCLDPFDFVYPGLVPGLRVTLCLMLWILSLRSRMTKFSYRQFGEDFPILFV